MIDIHVNPMKSNMYREQYILWIYNSIIPEPIRRDDSYLKLIHALHQCKIDHCYQQLDKNRLSDGIDLRNRFIDYINNDEYGHLKVRPLFEGEPCSVLEMLAAMAIRCEEQLMSVPELGNRSSKWFWEMLVNLGLDDMNDYNFNIDYIMSVVNKFLRRDYAPDGKGGLFYIPNCPSDMRNEELWVQLCWYMGQKE